jgi:hypothetical protein
MLVTFIVISLDLYATLSYCLVKTAYGSVFKSMPQGGEMNQALYAHMNNKRKMKKKKKKIHAPIGVFTWKVDLLSKRSSGHLLRKST